jgi:hydrogenase expression/formation protein HypD
MEVCGTHTHAVAKSGLAYKLKNKIRFISGPGCPVCVSAQSDIDKMISLALLPNVIIATFGDMMRVPGSKISLQGALTKGADIRIVYSPLDSLSIARENPSKKIIFLAVGFETTSPSVAVCVIKAKELKLKNFYIYCCLKIIAPALKNILDEKNDIDGFLLPGNVSVITGYKIFDFIANKYKKTAVAAGFSAMEILSAVNMLLVCINKPQIKNAYKWAKPDGNKDAQKLLKRVFKIKDGFWRGFGRIRNSALELKKEFENFDVKKVFKIKNIKEVKNKCRCALILKGKITPKECPYFAKICMPSKPLGPCMVSSEGICAAYYNESVF